MSDGRRRTSILLYAALFLAVTGFITGCERAEIEEAPIVTGTPIIVTLNVGIEPGSALPSPAAVAEVRSRFMERLAAILPEAGLSAVRTYKFLPAVALSADADLIQKILEWPEVNSISADKEIRALE